MKKQDEIDALLSYYKDHMPKNVVLTPNHERFNEAEQAVQDIMNFVWETDENAQVNIAPDELTGSSVCVEITASLVVIDMVDKFCSALQKANNFEVYPREDGNIGLGIVFEDVFVPAPTKSKS